MLGGLMQLPGDTYGSCNFAFGPEGGCDLDKNYAGPVLPTDDNGKFTINIQFVRDMIQWFKDGKSIPRRYSFISYCIVIRDV